MSTETNPERHGIPQCVKCTNAAWEKSKRQWCWWCEGKPPINKGLDKQVRKLTKEREAC